MALYFIGIGLNDEKDITVKGLEAVKKCSSIYLETYTSRLACSIETLEKFYNKKIIPATRDIVENKAESTILKDAKSHDTAFLVIGDPLCATTHIDLMLRAKQAGIKIEVIHNASIVSAIGITGLEVYKFGKVTSIPFDNKNVKAPYEVYQMNSKNGLHTLFLLDLKPDENKYLSIKEAIEYLINQGIKEDTKAIACSHIGSEKPILKYGKLSELKNIDYKEPPYCIVIPGKLHFMEEEFLEKL
jgi:diphthine synthase